MWYEDAYRTTNEETGRKRKGNAKKYVFELLVSVVEGDGSKAEPFTKVIKEFRESSKLTPALQKAKLNLSPEDYEQFKKLHEKMEAEASKVA